MLARRDIDNRGVQPRRARAAVIIALPIPPPCAAGSTRIQLRCARPGVPGATANPAATTSSNTHTA
ncbi:hypothetical protein [Sphingomonas sp.]|uniref:hypothetical protein n=1 Tax=Sphingomonas sp. TaxID=28214 RepID=UPI003D6D2152